jgi:hypothetical protein
MSNWPFTFRAGIFNLEQEDFGRITVRHQKEYRLAGFYIELQAKSCFGCRRP